ncbi:MAG: alkaline phosphatase [Bacteroidota bacterium]
MKIINTLISTVLFLIVSFGYSQNKAKYVFLFIGDGMGDNEVYATEIYKASLENKIGYNPLSFSQFPVHSYMTTYSANSFITCSSASATAMATGFKTNNGVVSMDTTFTVKYKTIAERAKDGGYKVGILSTVPIDHATPACFYAHQKSRKNYDEIALQLPVSNFDFFGGGGVHNLGSKDDKNSFINKSDKFGYRYLNTKKDIEKLKKGDSKIIAVNPGTYSGREYYWEIDNRNESISLSYLTKKGIEILDNDKGFFMMVEGGKIDWALHSNDLATALHEITAFDDAVKEAINFYNNHKDETLIIVTADHETGGLVLANNSSHGLLKLDLLQHQKISAQEFERDLSELRKLERKVSFNEVLDSVEVKFGLGNKEKGLELTKAEKNWLFDAYINEFVELREVNPDRDYLDQYSDKPLTLRVITVLNTKAGVGWAAEGHSALKVPVKVLGVGQEHFRSTIDNTDIAKKIMKVMQLQ